MKKLILILIVFFSSCSKENVNPEGTTNSEDAAVIGSSSFFEENFKNKTVIVAGGTIEDGAVVWINDKKILLLNDALEATGLFYSDNKIYVTGWTYGGKGSVWTMDWSITEIYMLVDFLIMDHVIGKMDPKSI